MIEFSLLKIILLFSTGLLAGTVDAIAGGGGLICIPMLLSLGMPAPLALGTNKLQSSIGTFAATYNFFKKGHITFQLVLKGLILGIFGTILGSITAQVINSALLQKLIPFFLLAVFLYSVFTPRLGLHEQAPKFTETLFYPIAGFILGFYDGFLGPGTGSFWIFALVFFLGFNLAKASAYTKVFNLKSNLIAVLCFMLGQNIDYKIGLIMACGQLIGGRLGSELVITRGARLVRPIFLIIVAITMGSLFYKNFFTTALAN